MKVLILHQHFNTPEKGGALRSYYLAKALQESGLPTVVITAHTADNYEVKSVEGIEVHYLAIPYDNRFGFWNRGLAFLRFAWEAYRLVGRIEGISLCYAISVPLTVGLAARWIKRKHSIPFVFEVGDLWPDAPVQLGYVKNYFFKKFLFGLEKSIYTDAESIVALSPMIKEAIQKKIDNKVIHLVPNMADTEFYAPTERSTILEKKFGVEGKFVVSYIGAIGVANGLDYFIECACASAKAQLPVHFLLCGDGARLASLQEAVQQLQLSNFSFIPFQDRAGVAEVMHVTDASFICYKAIPILETGSPNKYFDALAAGKLIIINFGGWIRDEIEKNACGVFVNAHQPADFVEKLNPFLNDSLKLKSAQRAAAALANTSYARKILSEKFVQLISDSL